jgi:hypothetical protein
MVDYESDAASVDLVANIKNIKIGYRFPKERERHMRNYLQAWREVTKSRSRKTINTLLA